MLAKPCVPARNSNTDSMCFVKFQVSHSRSSSSWPSAVKAFDLEALCSSCNYIPRDKAIYTHEKYIMYFLFSSKYSFIQSNAKVHRAHPLYNYYLCLSCRKFCLLNCISVCVNLLSSLGFLILPSKRNYCCTHRCPRILMNARACTSAVMHAFKLSLSAAEPSGVLGYNRPIRPNNNNY